MTTVSTGRRRRALLIVVGILALQVLFASPASAASSCVPHPERPTAGLVASIDEPRPDHGLPNHPYGAYAYAGTRWYTYTDNPILSLCGDPFAHADTWLGNQFFNVGKTMVAAHNSLWYLLIYGGTNGPVLSELDHGLANGAKTLYDNAFTPLLSLVLVIAVVWILFKTLKGALAHIATKLMWILCAFWVAASSYLMPGAYTTVMDSVLTEGIQQIHDAVLTANGYDGVHGVPQLLYDQVIRNTWLEGEFGSSTSPIAHQQGPRLQDAQAWSKNDNTDTVTDADLERKKATFVDVAQKARDAGVYDNFTGTTETRFATGFLGMLRGFCYSYFPLMAELGQLFGMLILRLVILFAPILGLLMILYQRAAPAIARGVGKALASCVLLAVGSTGYLWILPIVLTGTTNTFVQMVIMGVITITALILIRPLRQITGMITGIVQAAGFNTTTGSPAASWAMRTWRRHRWWNKREQRLLRALTQSNKRSTTRPEGDPEPNSDSTPEPTPTRRPRPEAHGPQRATAVRLPTPPTARPHGPAARAGQLGPRIFFHGPRVFSHGPPAGTPGTPPPAHPNTPTGPTSTPGLPPAPGTRTTGPTPPPGPDPLPSPSLDSARPSGPDHDPHHPTTTDPGLRVREEFVVPSEHEDHARRRAEGNPTPTNPPEPVPEVIQVYRPSQDQIVTYPADPTPPPTETDRPEGHDRGDDDADPN